MEVLEPVHGARRASALAPRPRVCWSRLWSSRLPRLSRATASWAWLWVSPPPPRVVSLRRRARAPRARSPAKASRTYQPVAAADASNPRQRARERAYLGLICGRLAGLVDAQLWSQSPELGTTGQSGGTRRRHRTRFKPVISPPGSSPLSCAAAASLYRIALPPSASRGLTLK